MKSIILASNRTDNQLYLNFVKNQEFVNLIIKIIGKFHINWGIFQNEDEKTEEVTIEKIINIEDELYQFEDDHLRIYIFVGHKKVIFIMSSSKRLQKQILDEIKANSKWK